ncbi:hypothetical protein CPB86DRAFT_781723, partial [Serendipita vermifera]
MPYHLEIHFPRNSRKYHIPGLTCEFWRSVYQVDVDLNLETVKIPVHERIIHLGDRFPGGELIPRVPCPSAHLNKYDYLQKVQCGMVNIVTKYAEFFVGTSSNADIHGINVTARNKSRILNTPLLRVNLTDMSIDVSLKSAFALEFEVALSYIALKHFRTAYPKGVPGINVMLLISVYKFNSWQLWQVYVPALFTVGLIVIFPGIVIWKYGSHGSNELSTFIIFIRQESLKMFAEKAPLGPHQLPEELKSIKLGFGYINDGEGHTIGFGVIGEDDIIRMRQSKGGDNEVTL